MLKGRLQSYFDTDRGVVRLRPRTSFRQEAQRQTRTAWLICWLFACLFFAAGGALVGFLLYGLPAILKMARGH